MKSFSHIFNFVLTATAVVCCCASNVGYAAQPDAEGIKFFEQKIRPVLADRCIKCHGVEKQKGQLRLDTLLGALKGGETKTAIVPGDPAKSLLISAIEHTDPDLTMPPKEEKMPEAERAAFAQWVKMGAPWPENATIAPLSAAKKHKEITAADRAFWSFQPVANPPVPSIKNTVWAKNEIDHFIVEKLAATGLEPAPEADRRTLIRRVTLDLHGIPPTPEEVDAFIADTSTDAYEKLVDRLLASPRYGERAGRQWLDLVRYGESDGFRQDAYRPNAWLYRDYVIKSMNTDKPYDRFITEQLAGDELDPNDPDVFVGTAFLRLSCYEYNQRDVPRALSEYLCDITDVCGDVFMGLSMSCAHCHDHKFDPILQKDYYRLQAFFTPLRWHDDLPIARPNEIQKYKDSLTKWEENSKALRGEIAAIEKPFLENARHAALKFFEPDFQKIANKPESERTPYEIQITDLMLRQVVDERKTIDGKIKGAEREKWSVLKTKMAPFDAEKPKPLQSTALVRDIGSKSPPTVIPGDPAKTDIEPGFLTLLDPKIAEIPTLKNPNTTGRRTALAAWLSNPGNPFTSRVMVNRLWQYRFGRGIVATSSDYGKLGEKPSHPELLDWLATRFVKDGWSMKKANRLMVLSATYRQASNRPMPEIAKLKDPENRLLWRINARRLDAQQIRDAMIAVSGELESKNGGPPGDFTAPSRAVYTKVLRNTKDAVLDAFDEPDGLLTNPVRNVTTTATQSLLMINGQWPLQRASAFASRVKSMSVNEPDAIIDTAYRLAFGRVPRDSERVATAAFLGQKTKNSAANETAVANAAASQANQSFMSQAMPVRGGQAALVREKHPEDHLKLTESKSLPSGDFTIEAVVLLESIAENADVRTIVSQWDGVQTHPGWLLGVTSEKSKYQPRNLILQMCDGDPKKGSTGYEVIPSDLKIELHKTYYVAASVKMSDTGETGITFYTRDLTDMDSTIRSAKVKHKAISHGPAKCAFMIGARDGTQAMTWHGLIDEVKLSTTALAKDQLFISENESKKAAAGHWRFEENPGFFKDSDGLHNDLQPSAATKSADTKPRANPSLIDFCHVLFNSNEFIYVE
ncbi:MAG: DUF1549 domain-containing protein [Planctomycetota bacterium]